MNDANNTRPQLFFVILILNLNLKSKKNFIFDVFQIAFSDRLFSGTLLTGS